MRPAALSPGSRVAAPPINSTAGWPDRRGGGSHRYGFVVGRLGGPGVRQLGGLCAVAPGHVGRQDQGRDSPRRADRRPDRRDRVGAHLDAAAAAPHPPRHTASHSIDVGFQWCVVLLVVRGVVADHHDHRHAGPSGVVQVGQPVAQAGAEVQQHRRRLLGVRAYPSAAPVATPSNNVSTPRSPGTSSRAATKCISDVPGFAKQTLSPPLTRVWMSAWAPFTTTTYAPPSLRSSVAAVAARVILMGFCRPRREPCSSQCSGGRPRPLSSAT